MKIIRYPTVLDFRPRPISGLRPTRRYRQQARRERPTISEATLCALLLAGAFAVPAWIVLLAVGFGRLVEAWR